MFEDDFNEFWRNFPHKVGKLAAQAAYKKARTMASAQQILEGVERYKTTKPAYADWCHPRTFLCQGRWLDEVAPSVVSGPPATKDERERIDRMLQLACGRLSCSHEPACETQVEHIRALINGWREPFGIGPLPVVIKR